MLDQSFSFENFKVIYDLENRKGNFNKLFYSDDYINVIDEIKGLRKEIKNQKSKSISDDSLLSELIEKKNDLEKEKERILENELTLFSKEANREIFSFELKSFTPQAGKTIYTTDKDAVSYFAMKQLQRNIYRTFKVKQSDRHHLVRQLKLLLQDNFPKIVIRTDIKSFYESVPQFELLKLIENNTLLNPKSKLLIKKLLYNFNNLTKQTAIDKSKQKGIPRGAGVSAYLAELYMRSIDNEIKSLNNVSFYGRYVDDIIIVFTPKSINDTFDYLSEIREIIIKKGLEINEGGSNSKTKELNLLDSQNQAYKIDFLGYSFQIQNANLTVLLSENKINKYTDRISLSLDDFLKEKKYNYKEAKKLLIHRLNYLTKNTRLHQPKRGFIGIYYSNSLLDNNSKSLNDLDSKFKSIIHRKLPLTVFPELNVRLIKRFSFKRGFQEKSYFNINSKVKKIPDIRSMKYKKNKPTMNNFERIVSVWKS
jgi:hypothetical protein